MVQRGGPGGTPIARLAPGTWPGVSVIFVPPSPMLSVERRHACETSLLSSCKVLLNQQWIYKLQQLIWGPHQGPTARGGFVVPTKDSFRIGEWGKEKTANNRDSRSHKGIDHTASKTGNKHQMGKCRVEMIVHMLLTTSYKRQYPLCSFKTPRTKSGKRKSRCRLPFVSKPPSLNHARTFTQTPSSSSAQRWPLPG